MNDLRKTFINNLKYYRRQKNMRQLDLSVELGRGANYINSIENGKYFPSPETISQICEILNIKAPQLFDENASPENVQNFSKDEFIERVITDLHSRLMTDIRREMENVLTGK